MNLRSVFRPPETSPGAQIPFGLAFPQPYSRARPAETAGRQELMRSVQKGLMAAGVGMAVNIVLAIVKIVTGIVGNSYALIADGIESTTDIVSSLVVWTGLKISSLPADEDHPYGHGKAESIAGMVVALALLAAAVFIAIQSVREIITPHHAPAWFTLLVLALVIGTKETLYRFVFKVGDELTSTAVKGDAWHHRSDAITSAAAFIGISIALIGGKGYESADDWAALLACAVILFNGYRIFRAALRRHHGCRSTRLRSKRKSVNSPPRCRAWCASRNAGLARAGWACLWKSTSRWMAI